MIKETAIGRKEKFTIFLRENYNSKEVFVIRIRKICLFLIFLLQ